MFTKAEDNGFLNGTGIDMPTGILSPTNGVEIGASTKSLSYDDLIKLYLSIKPKYRKNGTWLMNDDTALALRTLKDISGAYLWNNENNTILGKPVVISEYMPGAEKGTTPVLFGDFHYYWVVRRSPSVFGRSKKSMSSMTRLATLPSSTWTAGLSTGRPSKRSR